VRYVLEGSGAQGRKSGGITAQLIDAINGAHISADRFDGSLEDVVELQDKVAISVAGIIEPTLRQSEIEATHGAQARRQPRRLRPYIWRALPTLSPRCLRMRTKRCSCSTGDRGWSTDLPPRTQ